ncbi:hypothetical protein ACWJJH_22520, partial [Endozoicomonadaceae bacterium StTr2]
PHELLDYLVKEQLPKKFSLMLQSASLRSARPLSYRDRFCCQALCLAAPESTSGHSMIRCESINVAGNEERILQSDDSMSITCFDQD